MTYRTAASVPTTYAARLNWFEQIADLTQPATVHSSDGSAEAVESPIGLVPRGGAIDTEGLDSSTEAIRHPFSVEENLVRRQLRQLKERLAKFGEKLPTQAPVQLEALEQRLG